jgi:hypothetical protein
MDESASAKVHSIRERLLELNDTGNEFINRKKPQLETQMNLVK